VVKNTLLPSTVEKFFNVSSYGKFSPKFSIFPSVITLNSLDSSFAPYATGRYFNNGEQQDARMMKEAVSLAKSQASLSGYSRINVFAPTSKSLGYYGGAHIGLPLDVGSKILVNSQLVGQIGTVNSPAPSWKVFGHEYGHLLGMYDYYIPGIGTTGKSPGPFDFMGNTIGGASTFFGFSRWVQGWIEDTEVICDYSISASATHTLTPLNQNSGKKLYVHPIDGSLALVIEFRTETEFDLLKGNDGLLVYLIDMKIGSLKGPISIQPSEQDLVLNPRDDVEMYSRAPLSSGQSVKVKDLVIYAEDVSKERATFKVLTSAEYLAKKDAEAKAEAELKAKQEAELKVAAELKAKLDAEEATAKAAAELKSKQEADAKAVATKKITITCVKGKLTKKVTAIKPKCPNGYKLKK
jgi:M6 family metalloprotease-like protein